MKAISVLRLWTVTLAAAVLASTNVVAETGRPVPIEQRAQGAERIVVASVAHVSSRMHQTEFGDTIIVSDALLSVEETIKGKHGPVTMTLEGGTVNGFTMRVSSLPVLLPGERGVFFLERGKSGEFRPHLRGQGILKLDAANRVKASSLTLADIRRMARGQ
jgi:hypothetical protein